MFFNAEEHQVDLHIGIKEDDIEENDEEFLVKISPFERSITRRSKRSPVKGDINSNISTVSLKTR